MTTIAFYSALLTALLYVFPRTMGWLVLFGCIFSVMAMMAFNPVVVLWLAMNP